MPTQSFSPAQQPNWDSITEPVLCPLCGYDLRGLSEPRCPECGYTFDWPDMLDPTRRLHPYVFEHHPERNFRSFLRTAAGALLPRRFWRSLQPVQPSRPGRLVLYWLLVVLICFLSLQASFLWYLGSMVYIRWTMGLYVHPYYALVDVVRWYFAEWHLGEWLRMQVPLVLLLWPWGTFAVLMIFRWSMRLAKIRPIHVLRCTIYSSGTFAWLGLVGLASTVAVMACYPKGPGLCLPVLWTSLALTGMLLLAMLYQLIVAYRLYLRFDHAIATVLCSQLILALTVATIWVVSRVKW